MLNRHKYKKFLFIIGGFFLIVFSPAIFNLNLNAQSDKTGDYVIPVNKNVGLNSRKGVITVNNDFDYRIKVLDTYFERNKSPLTGYGKYFVKACDKHSAPRDCTLLPAIGYIETRLCTLALSDRQKNCWGWGGAGSNRVIFPDYETSIDHITKQLMSISFYGTRFFNDPTSAQLYYCGQHCNKWGGYVQDSRNDINRLSVELGYPKLF